MQYRAMVVSPAERAQLTAIAAGKAGVERLLRDKTHKPGKAPLVSEITARVVVLTCTEPPHQATHWTGGDGPSDRQIDISPGSVHPIAAAPLTHLQALAGSPLCRRARRHRWALR
jgi:hypothetical protein